ncbi:MAG: A24 family peptidase [Actinobacteria bacterium]|nr:A24 family peptidase [Actinomycetota bacterium]
MIPYVNLILAGILTAICTYTDIKSMTIYNRHTYPAAVSGLVYSIATAQWSHLYGSMVILSIYLFFFLSGKMGGGDLKLAVALSLFLGHEPVLCGSILAGMVLMAWGLAYTWYKTGQLKQGVMVAAGRLPGGEVPYGAVLGPATMLMTVLQLVFV